jgi:hypothetical protein
MKLHFKLITQSFIISSGFSFGQINLDPAARVISFLPTKEEIVKEKIRKIISNTRKSNGGNGIEEYTFDDKGRIYQVNIYDINPFDINYFRHINHYYYEGKDSIVDSLVIKSRRRLHVIKEPTKVYDSLNRIVGPSNGRFSYIDSANAIYRIQHKIPYDDPDFFCNGVNLNQTINKKDTNLVVPENVSFGISSYKTRKNRIRKIKYFDGTKEIFKYRRGLIYKRKTKMKPPGEMELKYFRTYTIIRFPE